MKGKTERRTVMKLTGFMSIGVRANCPLIVSFMRWAGAWPFFSGSKGTTPLHAALKAGHLALVEVMVQDLGASLYIPDSTHYLPKDMELMPADLLKRLELVSHPSPPTYVCVFVHTHTHTHTHTGISMIGANSFPQMDWHNKNQSETKPYRKRNA